MRWGLLFIMMYIFSDLIHGQETPSLHAFFVKESTNKNPYQLNVPTKGFQASNLKPALFCRIESKWEKKAGHGVRFRLGDVQTVDRLEGKINPASLGR